MKRREVKHKNQKKKWCWQRVGKVVLTVLLVVVIAILFLAVLGTVAYAGGLVDDTINAGNEYSKYPLGNYQLDFYVDNSWGWLPWNWLDGIGKQVMYGLYAITNFIWTISLYLSNATGYLVQEAYSLDFISTTADSIGKNMQTIAGVSTGGLSTDGFYMGFLLILILIVGIYVAYTGLIKRETTKAIHAVVNFVVVFVLSASFITYAPDYVSKINDFSSDISNASLSLGTKIVLPGSQSQGKDSIDLIRDSLFSIQVQQPWLLLQYGNSDIEAIGTKRVEQLLSTSPDTNNGEDREDVVIKEIEDRENTNLTITKTVNRLGMVFFLFLFNIGISVFVFLLTGIMIFSQVLFIVYAMLLPISFILSTIPTFDGMTKRAVTKLFNTLMTRAGITLIITIAFSISTMFYTLSASYPFFFIAFLQIITFAGIYFKLGDFMSMFSLQSGDSQSIGRQIFRKPRMLLRSQVHRFQRKLGYSAATIRNAPVKNGDNLKASPSKVSPSKAVPNNHTRPDGQVGSAEETETVSLGKQVGQKVGAVMDTKNRVRDTVGQLREQKKDLPTHAKYALYRGKSQVLNNIADFKSSVTETKEKRQNGRKEKEDQRRKTIAEHRAEMEPITKEQRVTESKETVASAQERPIMAAPQEKSSQLVHQNQNMQGEQTDEKEKKTVAELNKATPPLPQERPPMAAPQEKSSQLVHQNQNMQRGQANVQEDQNKAVTENLSVTEQANQKKQSSQKKQNTRVPNKTADSAYQRHTTFTSPEKPCQPIHQKQEIQRGQMNAQNQQGKTIAEHPLVVRTKKITQNASEPNKVSTSTHERPATTLSQEKFRQTISHDQNQTVKPDTTAKISTEKSDAKLDKSMLQGHVEQQLPVIRKTAVKADIPRIRTERQMISGSTPPERTEIQIVSDSDSQYEHSSHAEKQIHKMVFPSARKGSLQSVKERNTAVKHTTNKKEKTKATNTETTITGKGQKK